jgi:CubicO group peptidase (beta-lactamase class C family)
MRYLAIFFLLSLHGAHAQTSPQHDIRDLKKSISSLFDEAWNQHQFSGVLLVAKNGNPLYFQSKGYRNYITKTALNTNDLFELASVSKQFTSMIIMMLKEKGLLGYDDPLERYIKGLPYNGITLRHLLTHTSGLPDYQNIMDKHWDKNKIADNVDIIDYLKKYPEPVHFAPGEKYEYSNTGYVLLASVAEAASGIEFKEMVKKWIFIPLKMKSADFRTPASRSKVHNFARGFIYDTASHRYAPADSFRESNYTIWLGNRKGPGRISMNATDLLKWDQALYTPMLVASTTLDEAFTPYILNNKTPINYGFGWELKQSLKLGKVVHHSGDNPGYHTHIMRYLDKKYTVILLNNNASNQMNEILDRIEDLLSKL